MPIHNKEIADTFIKLANLLEIEGANPFRVRAYRNAARIIGSMAPRLSDLVKQGEDLTELPGIGDDLAEKIRSLVNTGELPLLKQVEARTPPILHELMKIEGLGPKRVKVLYKKLGIQHVKDLQTAIKKGRVRKLDGFGEKTEQKILSGIQHLDQYTKRMKLADAVPVVDSLLQYIKQVKGVLQVDCAGSYRRKKETVGDLDILVAADKSERIISAFTRYDEIANVTSQGSTRASAHLHSGFQVDLRVVSKKSYGAALLYFTGSKEHNIAIRKIAVQKQLKLNEYGIFRGDRQTGGQTEKEIYKQLGLSYIEPELREDRGEIFAASKHRLPKLITLDDIRGDLHSHTHASDGDSSLEQMADAAEKLGYDYLAVTDHSKHLTIAHGLDKKALFAQIRRIDKFNSLSKKLVILKSMEIDILDDGSLDMSEDVLKELDMTVCSIHSKFALPPKKQTERILKAMDNLHFNILAHPTGRLINQREPYSIDIERVMNGARERGCILELNAQPERMDLNDIHCKMAKDAGVRIAISSDAHSPSQLSLMRFGIYQARRGWLEKDNVINTRSLKDLKKLFKR